MKRHDISTNTGELAVPVAMGDRGPKIVRTEELAPLVRSAKAYASESRARRTREEYAKQWAAFCAWCREQNLCELPAAPQTLALYLAARADQGRKVSTLAQALAAIAQAHELAGQPSPRNDRLVKETWKGVRRRLGIAPSQKHPLSAPELRRMIEKLPAGLIGVRDRALLTLGFAGAFRRSELVALNAADVVFVAEGLEGQVCPKTASASSPTSSEPTGPATRSTCMCIARVHEPRMLSWTRSVPARSSSSRSGSGSQRVNRAHGGSFSVTSDPR